MEHTKYTLPHTQFFCTKLMLAIFLSLSVTLFAQVGADITGLVKINGIQQVNTNRVLTTDGAGNLSFRIDTRFSTSPVSLNTAVPITRITNVPKFKNLPDLASNRFITVDDAGNLGYKDISYLPATTTTLTGALGLSATNLISLGANFLNTPQNYNYAVVADNNGVFGKRPIYTSTQSITRCGNFNRNCPTNTVGSNVQYCATKTVTRSSVASQAEADASAANTALSLAQEDVNTNGQAYANTNGTCTNAWNIGGIYENVQFLGEPCYDIAKSNDNLNYCGLLADRNYLKSDFNNPNRSYGFVSSFPVSNVRFFYSDPSGKVIQSISGNNPGNNVISATAIVSFKPSLNTDAVGLTTVNGLTATLYAVYNNTPDNTGSDVQVNLKVQVQDCNCCGAWVENKDPIIFSQYLHQKRWINFMCYNLGANTSQNGSYAPIDKLGDLYQIGRRTDGHEKRNSTTTNIRSTSTIPGHNQFITTTGAQESWYSGTNQNRQLQWGDQNGKGANDPCPPGYEIPTSATWRDIYSHYIYSGYFIDSNATANIWNVHRDYDSGLPLGMWIRSSHSSSSLYLPYGGYRRYDGVIVENSSPLNAGSYATREVPLPNYMDSGQIMHLDGINSPNVFIGEWNRGVSVRCVRSGDQ